MNIHLVIFKKRFATIYQAIKRNILIIRHLQDNQSIYFRYKSSVSYLSQHQLHNFVIYLSNRFMVKE